MWAWGRDVSACGRPGETYRRFGGWACRRGQKRIGVSACGKDTTSSIKMGVALAQKECNTFAKNVMDCVKHFRELDVYQGAMSLVMGIFELTKEFPIEEKYALSDQVRRSSRSVCANLAEAWRKRRYRASFVSKLNDAESEAAETQVHVEIAFRHGYLKQEVFDEIDDACDKILAQLVKMIDDADRWVIKPRGGASRV